MKSLRQMLIALLAVLSALCIFAACGGPGADVDPSGDPDQSITSPEDPSSTPGQSGTDPDKPSDSSTDSNSTGSSSTAPDPVTEITFYLNVIANGVTSRELFLNAQIGASLADTVSEHVYSVDAFDYEIDGKTVAPHDYLLSESDDGMTVFARERNLPPKEDYIVSFAFYGPNGDNLGEAMIYDFTYVIPPEEHEGLTVGYVINKYLADHNEIGNYKFTYDFVRDYCTITHYDKFVEIDSGIGASCPFVILVKEGAPTMGGPIEQEYEFVITDGDGNHVVTYTFTQTTPPSVTVNDILHANGWYGSFDSSYEISGDILYSMPEGDTTCLASRTGEDQPGETVTVSAFVEQADGEYRLSYSGSFPEGTTVGYVIGYLDIVEYAYKYTVSCSCGLNGEPVTSANMHALSDGEEIYFNRIPGESYPDDPAAEEIVININVYDKNGTLYTSNGNDEYSYTASYPAENTFTYYEAISMMATLYLFPVQEIQYAAPTEVSAAYLLESCELSIDGRPLDVNAQIASGTINAVMLTQGHFIVEGNVLYSAQSCDINNGKSFYSECFAPTTLGELAAQQMGMYEGESEDYMDDTLFGNFVWLINGEEAYWDTELSVNASLIAIKKPFELSSFTVTVINDGTTHRKSYSAPVYLDELIEDLGITATNRSAVIDSYTYNLDYLNSRSNYVFLTDKQVEISLAARTLHAYLLSGSSVTSSSYPFTGELTARRALELASLSADEYTVFSYYDSTLPAYALTDVISNDVLFVKTSEVKTFTLAVTYPASTKDYYYPEETPYEWATQTVTLNRPTWSFDIMHQLENCYELLNKGFVVTLNGKHIFPDLNLNSFNVLINEGGEATFDADYFWFRFAIDNGVNGGMSDVLHLSKDRLTFKQIIALSEISTPTDYIWEINGMRMFPEGADTDTTVFPAEHFDYTSGEIYVNVRLINYPVEINYYSPEGHSSYSAYLPKTATVAEALVAAGMTLSDFRSVELTLSHNGYDGSTVTVTDLNATLSSFSDFGPSDELTCKITVYSKAIAVNVDSLYLNGISTSYAYYQFEGPVSLQHVIDLINKENGTAFTFNDFRWIGYSLDTYEEREFAYANEMIDTNMQIKGDFKY